MTKQNERTKVQDELYGEHVMSRAPEHAVAMGMQTITKGLEAVKAKGTARKEMIEEIHAEYCTDPIVGGNYFSVALGRDITFKGKPRMKLEEIAVFQVKEGKIVSEQFFY
jgi:hypothetical protein